MSSEIPSYWQVPENGEFEVEDKIIDKENHFLLQLTARKDGPGSFIEEYIFDEDGKVYCSRTRPLGSFWPVSVTLAGDTPRWALFMDNPKTVVSLHLGELFSPEPHNSVGLEYELNRYLPVVDMSGYFLTKPDGDPIPGPFIRFAAVETDFMPDFSIFGRTNSDRFRVHSMSAPLVKGEGARFLMIVDNHQPAYYFRTYLKDNVGIVEQEYVYTNKPGKGVIKTVRIDTNKLDLKKAMSVVQLNSFDVNGNYIPDWRDLAFLLGDPVVTFKGPLRELLSSTEASK